MTFKPTEIETPKSESFSGPSEPGNGAPPPREPDPEKSLFQPVEVETPESKDFGDYASSNDSLPGNSRPDGSLPYRLDDGRRAVTQTPAPLPQTDGGGRPGDGVSSNRGYILTCDVPLSDLPGK